MKNLFKTLLAATIIFSLLSFIYKPNFTYFDAKTKEDCNVRNLTIKRISEESTLHKFLIDDNREGPINFHPFSINEIGGWENFIDAIKTDPTTSFEYIGSIDSRLSDRTFHRFRQYYQGIEVVDGGFTVLTDKTEKNTIQEQVGPSCPGCPPIGLDPCQSIHMINPNIYEDIDICVCPTFSEVEIPEMFAQEILEFDSSELKIVHNFSRTCTYQLTYLIHYKDNNNTPMLMWVDAISGKGLSKSSKNINKSAPTRDYSIQNMPDSQTFPFTSTRPGQIFDNSTTYLANPNLALYWMFGMSLWDGEVLEWDWVPTSDANRDWNTGDAPEMAYQLFWLTKNVIDAFSEYLGIDFNNVRIAYDPLFGNAGCFNCSPPNTQVTIGFGDAFIDYYVIGHELAHSFLFNYIGYDHIHNQSIQEAISDMIGIFIQSKFENIDWNTTTGRDLQNTTRNCFDDIRDLDQQHDRSEALGHWFYLCVEGREPLIKPMDINEVLGLVFDALSFYGGNNPDYPDLMRAMVRLAEVKYGSCSDQFLTILNAWEEICVPTNHRMANTNAPCVFLEGPNVVCEEGNRLKVCLSNSQGYNNLYGRWSIIGKNQDYYSSIVGMSGNYQDGGICLDITKIPKMPYYPQNITIQYWNPQVGTILNKRIQLVDCNRDDPTCEEYYGINGRTKIVENQVIDNITNTKDFENYKLRVFDIMGNQISIDKNHMLNYGFIKPQILIFTYWDEDGILVKSGKKLFIQ